MHVDGTSSQSYRHPRGRKLPPESLPGSTPPPSYLTDPTPPLVGNVNLNSKILDVKGSSGGNNGDSGGTAHWHIPLIIGSCSTLFLIAAIVAVSKP